MISLTANEKIYNFIKDCGVFFYATSDEGKGRVRPFGAIFLLNDRLYFGMGKHKRSYAETEKNPYIEICACKGGEWVRVRGRAVFDWSKETEEALFAQSPFLKQKYGPDSDLTHAAFYLEEMDADYNTMDGTCEKWA